MQNLIKICDFGWAVHSPLLRATQCGTPLYTPPEVVSKRPYDSKIDIWSIGILTYELLYGTIPFEIRQLDDMKEKFGLDETGDINCRCCFTRGMTELCGEAVVITKIDDDEEFGELVELKFDNESELSDTDWWQFSTDMIEMVEEK